MTDDEHEDRDHRQAQVFAWAKAAFTAEQATSLEQRGLRLLEEAIEAFQACSGDPAMAHKLVDYVFARPIGAIGQELGGVGVCALALAAAAGLSADAEEQREVARVLAKPIAHFTQRNAAKNDAGFLAVPAPVNRCRLARERAGLSIGQAARLLCVASGDLLAIEERDVDFALADHAKLADLYQVRVEWLVGACERYDYVSIDKIEGADQLPWHDRKMLAEFAASIPPKKPP